MMCKYDWRCVVDSIWFLCLSLSSYWLLGTFHRCFFFLHFSATFSLHFFFFFLLFAFLEALVFVHFIYFVSSALWAPCMLSCHNAYSIPHVLDFISLGLMVRWFRGCLLCCDCGVVAASAIAFAEIATAVVIVIAVILAVATAGREKPWREHVLNKIFCNKLLAHRLVNFTISFQLILFCCVFIHWCLCIWVGILCDLKCTAICLIV